jgi:F-type H+-transporting ATPase subunit gamma
MQKILLQARPYATKLNEIFTNLKSALSPDDFSADPLFRSSKVIESVLLVVISSDRGLCGAYNANIIKAANKRIKELQEQKIQIKLITVGRKAKSAFAKDAYQKQGIEILESFINLSSIPTSSEANLIASKAIETFVSGSVSKVELICTRFISLVASEVLIHNFLPIENVTEANKNDSQTILEPSAQSLVETLAPMYTENKIYQALIEATTSELAARMTAMSNATANAKDFIKRLLLSYNKARQASITQEISEIVGGAAALG